jgi:hypothetical protein
MHLRVCAGDAKSLPRGWSRPVPVLTLLSLVQRDLFRKAAGAKKKGDEALLKVCAFCLHCSVYHSNWVESPRLDLANQSLPP